MLSMISYLTMLNGDTDFPFLPVAELDCYKIEKMKDDTDCTEFFSYMIVIAGQADVSLNGKHIEARRGTLLILSPRMLICYNRCSQDFRALQFISDIQTTESLLSTVPSCDNLALLFSFDQFPVVTCTDDDTQTLAATLRLMLRSGRWGEHMAADIVGRLHQVLILQVSAILDQSRPMRLSHREVLFRRFIELVVKNYRSEHGTRYYAHQLCITPVYLAAIVRSFTQKSVKQLIAGLLYKDALDCLQHTDMQVKDIARLLGFSDVAAFSNFFKNQSGLSPTQAVAKQNLQKQ